MVISGSLYITPMLSVLNSYVKNTKHFLVDNVQMTLHERVREVISNSQYNQSKLAELLKVSRSAVSQWMSGTATPDGDNLFNLAEVNGYNYKWLRDGTGPKKIIASGSGPLVTVTQKVEEPKAEEYDTPEIGVPNLSKLMASATPRTCAALEKLEQAYQAGKLNQDDLELLDAIARRLTNDKDGENR